MDVFAYKAKDGLCIISGQQKGKDKKQSLYEVGGCIVASESHAGMKKVICSAEKSKSAGLDLVIDLLSGSNVDAEVFGCRGKELRSYSVRCGKAKDTTHRTENDPRLETLASRFYSKSPPSPKNISEALNYLYNSYFQQSKQKRPDLEIGFVTRKRSAAIRSPAIPPADDSMREKGRGDDSYRSLVNILEKSRAIDEKRKGIASKLYYRNEKKELGKNLAKAVYGVIRQNDNFVSRAIGRRSISSAAKNAAKVRAEKLPERIYTFVRDRAAIPSGKKLQQMLDIEFLKSNDQKLILEMDRKYKGKGHRGIKHDLAGALSRELGSGIYYALDNGPFVIVSCDRKEAAKIAGKINSRRRGYFSVSTESLLSNVKSASINHGIYTPERVSEFLRGNGLFKPRQSSYRGRNSQESSLWNLEVNGVYAAQNITRGDGVLIQINDTGSTYDHPDLSHNVGKDKGYNFVKDNDDPRDDNGHGTHVDGIIRGKSTGVATGCKPYFAKILGKDGAGYVSDNVRALDMAVSKGVNIVNMSLGSFSRSSAEEVMCGVAEDNGIVLVAAAGNEGYGKEYPAAYDSVISVAAIDSALEHAYFSNIDKTVEVCQPGVDIHSTYLNNGYKSLSGTSMASPHNAGIMGLLLSVNPSLSPGEARDLAKECCMVLGDGEEEQKGKYGAGMVMADELVVSGERQLYRFNPVRFLAHKMRR